MRLKILQGRYRGRSIAMPPEVKGNRHATPSMVKEAVFQLLDNHIQDRSKYAFLDLCAGSGQMGLEALSRGWGEVHLAEMERSRFSFLLKNCAPYRGEVKLHNKDFRRMGAITAAAGDCAVFLDPPYSFWNDDKCPAMNRFLENLSSSNQAVENSDIIILVQGPAPYRDGDAYCSSPLRIIETSEHTYRKQVLTLLRIAGGNDDASVKSAVLKTD